MENEIVKTEELHNYSPQGLISQALAQGLPVETLEKLMDLQERWEKNQAKKAFDEAMAKFQSKCPMIKKRKNGGKTKSGQVAYKYAPIEDIISQTKGLIAECGFSYLIKTPSFTDKDVTASCEVRHIAGHSETSTVTMPFINKNEMISNTQVVGGTITMAKRYAYCDAFGIVTMDEDNDAQTAVKKESIPTPKRDWKPQIKKCETVADLTAIFNQMTDEEKEDNKSLLAEIKKNIQSEKNK